ncbi:hypothetical protein HRE53_12545 [Acaryochloris sp. 'Moss Beach']|uniref:hypothetical protein n=1 Tax=Acaryochloris TaxID=155977 RepID=UPI001BAF8986|nr:MULTISPECIES: hypothetical protein [Acaryochloris]QUY42627.1 hypothetical protein I1H34_26295 [Acaryochloris marina S15]UJB71707.1 hypothetical protein HRE53_12545 [Acaryochloris sp. 'Moss Beach']
MTLAEASHLKQPSFVFIAKSFLIWTFTLTVCWLVVGFPLVVLMATGGALAAVALQAVLPMSAVALVAGGILAANALAIIVGAAMLTFKGIHPHEVRWLRWLNGKANPISSTIYAACPLTCDRN